MKPMDGIKNPGTHRPLRVCHLAYTFYETDNRVMRYANALATRGDEVEVIALRRLGQRRIGDEGLVRVIRLQRRSKTESSALSYFLKILWFMIQSLLVLSVRHARRPYDVVHVHNVPDFLVFAALLPKLTGSKVLLDIHDILPELYAGKFAGRPGSLVFRVLLATEWLSCKFADRVIVANHIWHARLTARSVSAAKCFTILNYPDLRIFKPIPQNRPRERGQFVILYPGSLSRHQGLDVAIKAFAAVCDRMPDAVFHIYGEGPARPELVALVRQLGLNNRVILREPLPVYQIAEVMAAADLGVEPKLAAGFGNEALSTKILEFMASGVPVLVSRTRVHTHYFDESVVRFFTPGKSDELADAMCQIYANYPEEETLQRAKKFAARYGWQERMGDYYELIDVSDPPRGMRSAPVSLKGAL